MFENICLGCIFESARDRAFCGVIGKNVTDTMLDCVCYTSEEDNND